MDRSAIAGRLARGCSAWKPTVTGPTSRLELSLLAAPFVIRSKIDAFGLFPGQIGYAANPSCSMSRAVPAVTDNRYQGLFLAPCSIFHNRPAGVARSAPASNTALLRTGRSASSTCTVAWTPTLRLQLSRRYHPQRRHQAGHRPRHRPHQLSLRRPGGRPVLIEVLIRLLTQITTKAPASAGAFCYLAFALSCPKDGTHRRRVNRRPATFGHRLNAGASGDCTCSGRTPRPTNRAVMPCSQGMAVTRRITNGAFSG